MNASSVGLGAIVTQEGNVMWYASWTIMDTEQKYLQIDQEMPGVVYKVEQILLYLYGFIFTAITNHKPWLEIIKSPKITIVRTEQWRLQLLPSDMTLQYNPSPVKAVEYTNCTSAERLDPQRVAWIWHSTIWWWGSSLGALGNVEYSFIAITPRSTLTWSSTSWSYLPTPPLGQDMTQGQFLSRV